VNLIVFVSMSWVKLGDLLGIHWHIYIYIYIYKILFEILTE
jgi:hypothetical protein